MAFLASLFDHTKRDVDRSWKTVANISALRPKMAALGDDELRAKTDEFRSRLADGTTLDELLVEAFAVVREAAWRVLGRRQYRFWVERAGLKQAVGTSALDELLVSEDQRNATEADLKAAGKKFTIERYMEPFDVQLIGGIMLHRGMIAEMKTGEGKTLVAAAPLYLNALEGKGAHLVTVNDFLVRYQGTVMGELYNFLGMTTAITQSSKGDGKLPSYLYDPTYTEPDGIPGLPLRPVSRQESYQVDILYTTNNEIGFDYLRDNIAMDMSQLAQHELNFAIVDEVDNILVDEARTPLILSGPGEKPSELYVKVDRIIRELKNEVDYINDEKGKNASLTEDGLARVERALGVENIADPENLELFQHVQSAVRAHACYLRDKDYLVKDGEVIIVDEFTGRLMYGRRFSEGLHQAIEAKEGVKVERESMTIATITFQNFFRLYKKLSGMTGTAKTEEQEFIKIYGLPVAVIPTNRPVSRKDFPDTVYKSEEAKLRGIIGEILQCESRHQPVLVGTRSVEFSERVSERLKADLLQSFALASILHQEIVGLRKINEKQRIEFAAILKLRMVDTKREREHLQKTLEKLYSYQTPNSIRLVQPEEIRQIEMRLERAEGLDNEIIALAEKVKNIGEISSNDARRIGEIICYQRLELVQNDRIGKVMEVCGLPAKATDPDNVRRLADIIDLKTAHDQLASLLARGIPHNILNAKYHEKEAHIVAQAGRPGAVTIATNMAGRGVDIMLGGNPNEMVGDIIEEWEFNEDEVTDEIKDKALHEARSRCMRDRELVVSQGGLAIVGTERHESRRIDNQLRGRSGRQGDPGSSRFFVSMQDELMRLFGPERIAFLYNNWDESESIAIGLISKQIETAQKKVEGHNFEQRENTLKYDDVMNKHRTVIYEQRRQVLEGANMRATAMGALETAAQKRVIEHAPEALPVAEWNIDKLGHSLLELCPELPLYFSPVEMRQGPSVPALETMHRARIFQNYFDGMKQFKRQEELLDGIMTRLEEAYEAHETSQGEENMRLLERLVILRVVDSKWMRHLDAMDFLRDGIGLRGYEQTDPLVAYSKESAGMWSELMADIQEEIAHSILRLRLISEEEQHQQQAARARQVSANRSDEEAAALKGGDRVAHANVGRNDLCPCGSGKKFKQCCMNKK